MFLAFMFPAGILSNHYLRGILCCRSGNLCRVESLLPDTNKRRGEEKKEMKKRGGLLRVKGRPLHFRGGLLQGRVSYFRVGYFGAGEGFRNTRGGLLQGGLLHGYF